MPVCIVCDKNTFNGLGFNMKNKGICDSCARDLKKVLEKV